MKYPTHSQDQGPVLFMNILNLEFHTNYSNFLPLLSQFYWIVQKKKQIKQVKSTKITIGNFYCSVENHDVDA